MSRGIIYGVRSRRCIDTLCKPLQHTLEFYAHHAPQNMDLTITYGHRGEREQNQAFASGASSKRWPESEHNANPSRAFDFIPYPFEGKKDWKDSLRFARIAGAILYIAQREGITLRWGGDWDQDGKSNDQTFMDLGHIEWERGGE